MKKPEYTLPLEEQFLIVTDVLADNLVAEMDHEFIPASINKNQGPRHIELDRATIAQYLDRSKSPPLIACLSAR